MRCKATRVDGEQCHALAMREDPDGFCGFHSKRNSFAVLRASEFTKAEAIKIIGQEIRSLRRAKATEPRDVIAKADSLRNLILVWVQLTTPEVEPQPRPLTSAERIKKIEQEAGR